MDTRSSGPMSIAAAERATGISRETLRIWERRYGFPVPGRDARGQRCYDAGQIARLRLVRQLLDTGQRAGAVVSLDEAALRRRLSELTKTPCGTETDPSALDPADERLADAHWPRVLSLLSERDTAGLNDHLSRQLALSGLPAFVQGLAAPLTRRVGHAWASASLGIDQEHLFTDVLTHVLVQATVALPRPSEGQIPRMVLSTVPGELHGLGMRMVQALCAAAGANTLCLGVQTPLADIARAARHFRADVVALSFSQAASRQTVITALTDLRALLDPRTVIWAGGSAASLDPTDRHWPQPGIRVITRLSDVSAAVQAWDGALPVSGP